MSIDIDVLRSLGAMILVLGFIVVYYASKGYAKTENKPLLFLAIGFVFVTAGAAVAGLLFELGNFDIVTVATIEAASEVIGFSLIVYSIVGSRE